MVDGSAVFSPCGRHRYILTREGDDGPAFVIVGLNPSTADAEKNDPTIGRERTFAEREGCGRLIKVNLYSMRSTDPKGLRPDYAEVNGPDADRWLATAFSEAPGAVICAWGASGVRIGRSERIAAVLGMIRAAGQTPLCFGTTKHGFPRHPLYLSSSEPLVPFEEGRK